MKDEKETRQNLLACAKKEFMEKGYNAASLRNICKNADVTTGALYFFFRDKADLFASIVEEPVNKLYEVMMNHYQEESDMETGQMNDSMDRTKDLVAAGQIIHYMYQYHDEFDLVLTKSQGSGFESCVDRFVEITEKHYRRLTDLICKDRGYPPLDDYIIHWMSHMHIDTFIHMISHEKSEEEALRHMKQTIHYFVSGFFGMISSQALYIGGEYKRQ